jgi:hypothetical protein
VHIRVIFLVYLRYHTFSKDYRVISFAIPCNSVIIYVATSMALCNSATFSSVCDTFKQCVHVALLMILCKSATFSSVYEIF